MPRNILLIDTATNWASVSIYAGADGAAGELTSEVWHSQYNHGSELAPKVAALLAKVGLELRELQFAAVVVGPGKFSAIRTGIAYAIGLRLSVPNLKIVGIKTEEAEITPYRGEARADRPVYVTIPAGMRELIWYKYDSNAAASAPSEHGLDKIDDFVARLNAAPGAPNSPNSPAAPETPALLCGEGCEMLRERVSDAALLTPPPPPPPRQPETLLAIANERIARGEVDLVAIKPFYGREPTITPPKNAPARYNSK